MFLTSKPNESTKGFLGKASLWLAEEAPKSGEENLLLQDFLSAFLLKLDQAEGEISIEEAAKLIRDTAMSVLGALPKQQMGGLWREADEGQPRGRGFNLYPTTSEYVGFLFMPFEPRQDDDEPIVMLFFSRRYAQWSVGWF